MSGLHKVHVCFGTKMKDVAIYITIVSVTWNENAMSNSFFAKLLEV